MPQTPEHHQPHLTSASSSSACFSHPNGVIARSEGKSAPSSSPRLFCALNLPPMQSSSNAKNFCRSPMIKKVAASKSPTARNFPVPPSPSSNALVEPTRISKPTSAPPAPPFPTTRALTVVATRSAVPGATPPPPLRPAIQRIAAAQKPPEAGPRAVDDLFVADAIRPSSEGNDLCGVMSAAGETHDRIHHQHSYTEPIPPTATFAVSLRDLRPEYPTFLHDLPPSGSLLGSVAALLRQELVDQADVAASGTVLAAASPPALSPPKLSSSSSSSSASPVVEPSPNQNRKRRKKARRIGVLPKRRLPPGGSYGSPALLVPAVPVTHPPTVTPPSKQSRRALSSSEGSTAVTTTTRTTVATGGPRAVRFAAGSKEPRNEPVGAGAIASRGLGVATTTAAAAARADFPHGGVGSGHHRTKTTAAASARALAGAAARRRSKTTKTTTHR